MRELNVDIDALLAAFEYSTAGVRYYLNLETGRVVMTPDEIAWELEAIYEEFYASSDASFDLNTILQKRNLPDYHRRALTQAHGVEQEPGRYIEIPPSDSGAAYGDLQAFVNTLDDKDLRQKFWRAISGDGAFGEFKKELAGHPGLRKRWHGLSAERARKRVLAWLKSQQIRPVSPDAKASPQTTALRKRMIAEVLTFVRAAAKLPGVERIALIGSLATDKAEPRDVDVLVTVADNADLDVLAAAARQLRGHTQSFNRESEVFLADTEGEYLGRVCLWKSCGPGRHAECDALHCGQRPFLHDDLNTVRLSTALIATPRLELWPDIVTHAPVPHDIQFGLMAPLRAEKA
ncbi:MAG: hypothetical protein JXA21_29665 [Anaerolineae bacterium]|nr:hypothetical protein [Anaerolineae bacterium]